jgi:26S proteasome regulatory subunit N1
MTSVPKPLKFLRPFYSDLEIVRRSWSDPNLNAESTALASILSVLAMTYSDSGMRDTLHYRLLSRSTEDPGLWGNEYVRHLAAELGEEYVALSSPSDEDVQEEAKREEKKKEGEDSAAAAAGEKEAGGEEAAKVQGPPKMEVDKETLLALAMDVIPFFLKHNAEADAVDLLLELEAIEKIVEHVDGDTYKRVCLYMVSCVCPSPAPFSLRSDSLLTLHLWSSHSCVNLLVPPDDVRFLQTAHEIYSKNHRYSEAMVLAIRLNDEVLIRKAFAAPQNSFVSSFPFLAYLARPYAKLHLSLCLPRPDR